jgi:hypothetical protein
VIALEVGLIKAKKAFLPTKDSAKKICHGTSYICISIHCHRRSGRDEAGISPEPDQS